MTTRRMRSALRAAGVVCTVTGALALSACGSDQGAGNSGGSGSGSGGKGPVATRDLPGVGTVLVDSAGHTLYFTDTEQPGTIKCTGDCLELWHPVAAPSQPISDAPVADLGSVARPDGTSQLAYQNRPLYTFSLDGPDKPASGHNATDSFDGTEFTWHAVVVKAGGGQAPPNGGGYGGGGY